MCGALAWVLVLPVASACRVDVGFVVAAEERERGCFVTGETGPFLFCSCVLLLWCFQPSASFIFIKQDVIVYHKRCAWSFEKEIASVKGRLTDNLPTSFRKSPSKWSKSKRHIFRRTMCCRYSIVCFALPYV